MAAARKGMGFQAAQKQMMKKQGMSKASAGAILAAGARNASAKAKRANPNLSNVRTKKASEGAGSTVTVSKAGKPMKKTPKAAKAFNPGGGAGLANGAAPAQQAVPAKRTARPTPKRIRGLTKDVRANVNRYGANNGGSGAQ